ncbi:MAG: 2OG-Fe(II) oxygenase [Lewinellaceae bacterium]|nr:2OG-Fe(II) oxygenase [Phaeodactylibacter sp.]MCB9037290.1 2OG-Fe(II) oxygenase [Lewinellaceae bacterium]
MTLEIGQTVQVKAGQRDEDTGASLAGWSGRITALYPEADTVEVEWDSPTLRRMPGAFICHSLDEGYDHTRYNVETANIEAIEPKDSPFEAEKTRRALEAHYRDYELHGKNPPPPFSPGEEDAYDAEAMEEEDVYADDEPEEAAEQAAHADSEPNATGGPQKELLALLKTIEGSGSFAASGTLPFAHPGLHIEGVGEVGLPVAAVQAKEIIQHARRAPFGKGSQTVTDTNVRSAWEVDAAQLSFRNKDWKKTIQEIVEQVKQGLGIEEPSVTASLYKLLIYEPGDFFLPHQDSEKEKGMFGTLVVGLPSAHAGGELIVRFDGREETVDFSAAASSYQIPYAAFYADCEHEIRPVTDGYRVGLVYNLVQSAGAPKISSPQFSEQVEQMAEALRSMEDSFDWNPKAVLLGHQYTPANFSLAQLKLHDRPRAEALIEAADKAGYFASLGLATLYRSGELEESDFYNEYSHSRRYRYYDDEEEEEEEEEESSGGTMGEIYEEYMTVEHWGEGGAPGLGDVPIEEDDIIAEIEMGEGEPIEQEEEGYTGNAGMTIEYWYHYGAVVLWPQRQHSGLLAGRPVPVRLQWLEYYLQHWAQAELNPQEYARKLLASLLEDGIPEEKRYNTPDYSPAAAALARFRDESLLKQMSEALLPAVFENISVESWVELIQAYAPAAFHPVFQKAADTDDVSAIRHLLDVLRALDERGSPGLPPFVLHQARQLPKYLRKAKLQELETGDFAYRYLFKDQKEKRISAAAAVVENILALSPHLEQDAGWIKSIMERIAVPLPRAYANEVLAPILLSGKYKSSVLGRALYDVCLKDLNDRTAVKPSPPPDWKREVPKTEHYKNLWEILRPFLSSPTRQVYDYRQNESYRSEMERAIKSVEVDLKMETIKSGRPYTLRLTKTQAAYERKLREWEEDVALLGRLTE